MASRQPTGLSAADVPSPVKRKRAPALAIRRQLNGYLFVLPITVFFIVFTLYPALEAVRMSFFDFRRSGDVFVGLQNYKDIFGEERFVRALGNTFLYVLYIVPCTIVFSLAVSSFIYSMSERWTGFFRAVFYLPTVTSAVAISLVWGWIFNPGEEALANRLLVLFHQQAQIWFVDPHMALYLIVFIILTVSVGQPIVLYTAAMGSISNDYYEAAKVDGASRLQQFTRITMPLLMPTTLYSVVITTINAFQTFIFIHLLTSGGPDHTTTSIIYELYVEAFNTNKFGTASAMGIVLFLIVGLVAIFQFRSMTSKVEY
ncbi:carbohydrate ABC transporter permease [Paenibacillus thalictri]|uniref:Sugar ABC transporter permease n=1 Tax=Paenibacillus thalictri TaxID=2527873 RepID=A0A4Q9DN36_9BACL|nr:sugar ABC transporter permease [Paenibacillus thalictri]TBL76264.1 sugar ABC transporter permease [Paenibacillus thalictri]